MASHKAELRAALRIGTLERPGWERVAERTPAVGEQVYCLEGLGEVVKVLGRTGDGSRLLELLLDERAKPPFFAAASNVLVRTDAGEPSPEEREAWLGRPESAPAARGLRPEEAGG